MDLKVSVRIGDLILRQIQNKEEIVVPDLIRYLLSGDARKFRKHCAMDTGSEAGMTGFLGLFNCFGGPILVINFATFISKETGRIYSGHECLSSRKAVSKSSPLFRSIW